MSSSFCKPAVFIDKDPDIMETAKRLVPEAFATPPKTTGFVTYDVWVDCPHCNKRLTLNQTPYTDDGEYELGEDELGLALFGTRTDPATWENLEIKYTCCGCKKKFVLSAIET